MIEQCPAHLLGRRIEQNCTVESASQDERTHDHHKCLDLCVSQKPPSQCHSGHHLHSSGCSLFSLKLHICWALLVQGKYSCPHKTTPYSKCEWICNIILYLFLETNIVTPRRWIHIKWKANDCLLFAIITSSRLCLWGSQGSQKKGCSFLRFLS